MTPEQSLFLREFFLQSLEYEANTTKRVLAAVPDEESEYRPHPKYYTARQLAWHIAESETLLLNAVANLSFEFDQTQKQPETTAEIVSYYETNFAAAVARIKEMTAEQLATTVPFFNILNQPAVTYLSFIERHSIHHRGQLSAYLRPMGAKVPSIYGPSGDDKEEATEAASAS